MIKKDEAFKEWQQVAHKLPTGYTISKAIFMGRICEAIGVRKAEKQTFIGYIFGKDTTKRMDKGDILYMMDRFDSAVRKILVGRSLAKN